jgi:hypothetical protein
MPACEAQPAVNRRTSGSSLVVNVISPGGGQGRRQASAPPGGDLLSTTAFYPGKPRVTRAEPRTGFSFITVHEPCMAEFAPVIGRIRS